MSNPSISNRLAAAVFVSGAALGLAGCYWTTGAAEPPRAAAAGTHVIPHTATQARTAADPEAVERGRYLVTIGGCNDCHTPFKMGENGPEPDMSRMLQGHPEEIVINAAPELEPGPFIWAGAATNTAFAGPWGVSFARNLTPDENTGIGAWDETIFMNTIRNGRHWGVARPILPPMPWQNYRQMTDEDLRAVFAFLRSIPPIHNRIPEPLPPAEAMVATGG
jgi:mono/diheme cytochrome c family protein